MAGPRTALRRRRKTTTEGSPLLPVLERARAVGFLGPGPLRVHAAHASRYVEALPNTGGALRIIDLGSGGGVPGLPIFLARPDATGALLDTSSRRCAFLLWAVQTLGLADRVEVLEGRAEEIAQSAPHRHSYDVVVARGFGPPASTVECALGFATPTGRLVISEPPERRPWPIAELSQLGVSVGEEHRGVVTFDLAEDTVGARAALPRPIKQQRRRPLFDL